MGEVFFTKADIQGAEHLSFLLDDPCNCVILHPGGNTSKCHAGQHTKEGQLKAIAHLAKWEDPVDLIRYVQRVGKELRGTSQVDKALSLIQEVTGVAA